MRGNACEACDDPRTRSGREDPCGHGHARQNDAKGDQRSAPSTARRLATIPMISKAAAAGISTFRPSGVVRVAPSDGTVSAR